MVVLLRLIAPFLLFPAASALIFRFAPHWAKVRLFAVVNVLGALGLCILSPLNGLYFWQLPAFLKVALPVFAAYFAAVILHYFLLRKNALRAGAASWLTALFPICFMLAIKYAPGISEPFRQPLTFIGKTRVVEFFVGISYTAFRLTHMTMEVRNEVVPMPTIWEHLSFAFFVPTLTIGPISRYSVFWESLYKPSRSVTPLGRSALRMLKGLTKYLFLATMIEQLSYRGLLLDSHPHPWPDLAIAALAFYGFLYLNFSGYCDMAIGAAGLIGIRIEENFDRPFLARNLQEFWTRWHITLSAFLRDMVFSPLSKELIRRAGPAAAPHAMAVSILAVFVAMGLWHGLSWNFLTHGLLQGVGVIAVHYYTIWLKKRLGKQGYAAYMRSPAIRAVSTAATFLFSAGSLFFFANTFADARTILGLLR